MKRQLIGIFAEEWLEPVAHVLADLGTEKAWVVHGADGLDELTTTGITRVAVLEGGHVSIKEVAPEDAGLKRSSLTKLKGGNVEDNARAIREILAGARNPFRDIVLLNAGAALVVADKAENLAEGVELAASAIDQGAAARVLEKSQVKERARA